MQSAKHDALAFIRRFQEALELSRPLAAGGLSQALHSPAALSAPLSASWEGTRSSWASSGWGGTLGGLTAAGGGAHHSMVSQTVPPCIEWSLKHQIQLQTDSVRQVADFI